MQNTLGRRTVLRLAVLGGAASALSAACGGEPALSCNDTSGLSSADASFRSGQGYVERSTRGDRSCESCNFYTAAANACGSCTLLRGPINPAGYCNLWAARPT